MTGIGVEGVVPIENQEFLSLPTQCSFDGSAS